MFRIAPQHLPIATISGQLGHAYTTFIVITTTTTMMMMMQRLQRSGAYCGGGGCEKDITRARGCA